MPHKAFPMKPQTGKPKAGKPKAGKPKAGKPKAPISLSRKIFDTVLAFTIGVVLVFSIMTTTIFYFTYEWEAENELAQQAQDVAAYLNATPSSDAVDALQDQFAGRIRFTLIAQDGTVIYDSFVPQGGLENHADRPEVKEANEDGQATMIRYSDTIKTDMVYAAVKLDDGNIIRLSEARNSLYAFLTNMLLPLIATVVVIAVLVFLLSRVLTKRIMKPIDALNFQDPLENKIYAEMDPFLERIDEQQKMLRQQNDELALAETLRRDFSSNVSHEMKTPLQVISGYAELMQNNMVDTADSQKFAGLIYEEAQAMRSLIDDVLILSRLDESAIRDSGQPVDLYMIALRTLDRLAGFAEANDVILTLTGEHAFLIGSETVAEQMVYNLLENGIRYNHPGGSVRISIETQGQGQPAEPTGEGLEQGDTAAEADWNQGTVIVKVADTGVGIPEDMQDQVFERFFRVDKSRSKETGGTGLGLAIVKHSVLYHGGTIELESKPGEGTTFTLTFAPS